MASSLSAAASGEAIAKLLNVLSRPTTLLEAGALLGCLVVAWGLVRLMRGAQAQPGSVWFGDGVVDGVLFPLFALWLVFVARYALSEVFDVAPLALLRLALPVLVSLAVIRLLARIMQRAYPNSPAVRMVQTTVSWLVWIAVALWITGALPRLMQELDAISWKIGSTRLSMRNLIEGVLTATVVLVMALWISATLEARLLKGANADLSVRKMAANALRAVLLFIGLMFALSAAGIDLTALGVLGGALGVGIGFGLQKLAANYISGFVILAERSMRIGDVVKVDNFEGRISDITARYTVIRALDGRESIVPNEMMITQRIENSSLADRLVLHTTTVQVAYGSDLDALFPRLLAAVAAVPRVLAEPAPAVHLAQFAADGLELKLLFWITDPEMGSGNVRSDVNLAVLRALNAAGVEIPYPQRVVHTKNEPAQEENDRFKLNAATPTPRSPPA